jgi:stigma-specific protein Stig1
LPRTLAAGGSETGEVGERSRHAECTNLEPMERLRPLALLGVVLALGCDAALAEPLPFCTESAGCPRGTTCVDGARCVGTPKSPPAPERAPTAGAQQMFDAAALDAGPTGIDAGPRVDGGLCGSFALCGDRCVLVVSDRENCGECGVACGADEDCRLGVCCSALESVCGDECVDTTSDVRHCGLCGERCAGGLRCVLGACVK